MILFIFVLTNVVHTYGYGDLFKLGRPLSRGYLYTYLVVAYTV